MSLGKLYDKLTFQTVRHPDTQQTSITATVNNLDLVANQYMARAILEEISRRVADQLTKDWIAEHGPAVIEALHPGGIATAIRTKIEQEIAKKILG